MNGTADRTANMSTYDLAQLLDYKLLSPRSGSNAQCASFD